MADNNTRIVISAVDQASAVFGKVQQSLGSLTSSIPALGAALSVGGFAAMVKGSIDTADSMNDLSQRIGINIQNLAGWTLAANQSGTSMESVAKGVKGLSTYMVDHADKLKKAGITATDANGALVQLADIFKAMPDGVEKTALAVQLFGKAGMDMIPMLNLGSAGLAEAQEKAAEYGRRMAELAPQADKFNDLLGEMALQSKVLGINIGIELVPPMIKFAEQLMEGKKIAGGWTSAMWEFGVLLDPTKGIPASLNETRVQLEKLHAEMARGEAKEIPFAGETGVGQLNQSIALGERRKKYLEFLQRQEAMSGAAKLGDYRDARDLRLTNAGTMSAAEAMAKAKALTADKPKENTALQRMQALGQKNLAGSIDSEEDARILAEKRARQDARQEFEALQRMLKNGEENELAEYYRTGGEETMRLVAEQRTLKDAMKNNDNFARDMGMSFSSAFEDAIISGKRLSDVLQGLAQDIAKIVLRKAVTEPIGNSIAGMVKDSGLGNLLTDLLPKYAQGTPWVPNDGLAYLHKGEAVIPAGANGGGSMVVNIIEDSSRGGQVQQRQQGGQNMLDVFVDRVRAAVASDISRGSGPIPAAMDSTYGLNRAAGAY